MKSLRQRAPRVGLPQGRMGSEEAWQVAQMEKSYSRKKVSLGEGNVRRRSYCRRRRHWGYRWLGARWSSIGSRSRLDGGGFV